MDRRDFLKAAAAIPAAAAVPIGLEVEQGLTSAGIKKIVGMTWQVSDGWYAIVHPSQERQLRDLAARDRWQRAYLDWRKDGKPELTCQQILDKYRPIHEWEVDSTGEVGSIQGFKFITAEHV